MLRIRHSSIAAFFVLFLAMPAHAVDGDFETGVTSGLLKQNSIATEHFRIEFSDLVGNQTDEDGDGISDIVEIVAAAAEESWEVMVEDMGYDEPIDPDLERRVIIVLDDKNQYLSTGALGITSTLSNGDPYIVLDPWMSEDYLNATMAHEFFHAVQFGYDTGFAFTNHGSNWAEATATWMEDEVYDSVNDYVLYLGDYFDYTDYSVFASVVPSDSLFEYALNIWPRFLAESYDSSIIKDIWEEYFDSSTSDYDYTKVYDAVEEVVSDEGDELREVYREFALNNLYTEDFYEEGDEYPEVAVTYDTTQEEYTLIDEVIAPALYGSNYLHFENEDEEGEFYFHVVKSDEVSFAVSLVPMDGDTPDFDRVEYEFVEVGETLESYVYLDDLDADEDVVVVVSALERDFTGDTDYIFDQGYLYYYYGEFADSDDEVADEDFSEEVDEDGGDKEGDESSYGEEDGRDIDTLILSLVNYDEDSVSFSWNRLVDSDIEGYELHYGTDSDDYDELEAVDVPYITSATVSDLEEGETYYFQLIAVDEDGDQVGDESSEIAVTPMEWLFEDISYVHDYYESIAALVELGIFEGYSDGTFRDGNDINRAELLKILIEGRDITPDSSSYRDCFPDVGTEWYAKYVCYAAANDWVKGYPDGTFRPGDTVNKVEALKILFQVYEAGLSEGATVSSLPYDDLDTEAWYAIYLWKASKLGILEESIEGDFNPSKGRNRGEMAEQLYRYLVAEDLVKE